MAMHFDIPVSLAQIIIPLVCSGVLLYGVLLYLYLSFVYRNAIQRSIAFISILALIFVVSESVVIIYGAMNFHRDIAVHFHRLEQVAGAYFLFALPHIMGQLLDLSPRWHRINRLAAITGLVIASMMTVIAYLSPDLFISVTNFKASGLVIQSDYARGEEGIVYSIRDILLVIVILYGIVFSSIDMIKNKRFRHLLFTFLGMCIAAYGAIDDILYIYINQSIDLFPTIRFSRFSLSLTVMIFFFMIEMLRNMLNTSRKLDSAHNELAASEKRYGFIIEGTNDAIFSLDDSLTVLNPNKTALTHLPINRSGTKTHFYDLMFTREGEETFLYRIVNLKLKELREKQQPVSLRLELESKKTGEPEDYILWMEMVEINSKEEVLIKASRETANYFSKYVETEKRRFAIDNYLLGASEMSKRLTQNLPEKLGNQTITSLRMGLREMLINAIEHGNLEISFEDKTEMTMKGTYLQFIAARQGDEPFAVRKVRIDYQLKKDSVSYTIKDQGPGFDHKKFTKKKRRPQEELLHGRGIALAMSVFDSVTYNDKGNQVTCVKNFS
jgi:anti-sigma regulatory factor (Ser/Thr protein kinase)